MKISLGYHTSHMPEVGGPNGEKDTHFPTLCIQVQKGNEQLLRALARKGKALITFEPQTVTAGASEYEGDQAAGSVTLKIYSIEVENSREKEIGMDSDESLAKYMDTANLH